MQIKAMILCHMLEQHKSLYSYKLFFDQDCTATHGQFVNEESARMHAEVLARRIKVSLKWEVERSVADGFKGYEKEKSIHYHAGSKL